MKDTNTEKTAPPGATHRHRKTGRYHKFDKEQNVWKVWDGGSWLTRYMDANDIAEALVFIDHIGEPTKKPSMAELYPKYYKDFTGVDEVDVYLVHDRFQIDDPSGCIHHASKKLLLCGVRTGGKDMATEIKEARDTLTRKLQLMGVE